MRSIFPILAVGVTLAAGPAAAKDWLCAANAKFRSGAVDLIMQVDSSKNLSAVQISYSAVSDHPGEQPSLTIVYDWLDPTAVRLGPVTHVMVQGQPQGAAYTSAVLAVNGREYRQAWASGSATFPAKANGLGQAIADAKHVSLRLTAGDGSTLSREFDLASRAVLQDVGSKALPAVISFTDNPKESCS
jgi:hypothetical protein